jgi:DNA-binding transcriptional LysR family regulator
MDRFHAMEVFVAVAEDQGFAAAARRLQLSPPAVTRAVAALEQHLGVKLLNRSTRHVRVTAAGQRYLEDARRVLAEVAAAEESAAGINAEPRGHIAITAPVLFGRLFVMPAVLDYLQDFPAVEVSAVFLDRVVNLLEEGLDVGVRIGELPDSSMRALRVGSVRRVLCAAPGYLERHGLPQGPEDLSAHTIIASSAGNMTPAWQFHSGSSTRTIKLTPRLSVTTNDAAIEAAVAGFGITRLLSYQVALQLAAGTLKTVLSEFEPAPLPVHILHREERHSSTKVRSFIDLLARHLRADKALN